MRRFPSASSRSTMVVSPSSLPPAALSPVATTRETQPHSSSSNDNPTSKMMAGLLIGTASGHVVRRTSSYRTVLLAKAHAEHQSVAQKEEKSTTRRHASSHSVGMSVRVRPTTQRNAEWGGMATTVGPLSPGAMCPAPPRYQSLPARYRQQHAAHLQQPAKDVIFAKKSDLRRVTSLTAMPHYENSRTDNSQEEEEARSQTHHLSNGWEAPSTTTATTTTTGRAPLHEYLSKKGMGGSRLANLATASRVKMLSHTSGISATAAAAATTGVRKGGEGGGAQESLQKLLSRGYTTNNGGLRASRHTASAFSLASASLASSTASSAGDSVAATYSPRRSPPPPPPPPKVVVETPEPRAETTKQEQPAAQPTTSSPGDTEPDIRRAMGMLLKHRGGPGFGSGRLRGEEADEFEELMGDVAARLQSEVAQTTTTTTSSEATTGTDLTMTPPPAVMQSPPAVVAAPQTAVLPTMYATTPYPQQGQAPNLSDPKVFSSITCVEGAIQMIKNSPPELQAGMLVTLRAAMMSAVNSLTETIEGTSSAVNPVSFTTATPTTTVAATTIEAPAVQTPPPVVQTPPPVAETPVVAQSEETEESSDVVKIDKNTPFLREVHSSLQAAAGRERYGLGRLGPEQVGKMGQ
mmetsp:Transcript_6674/g.15233  ORF Transcript_6674/g.15233 Transcript_6674/m.15233 type:complete len:635 (-) Transcript_6674:1597-3501(-)